MYQKTAKDLAFDRERQKFRMRINKLEKEIRDLECDILGRDSIIEYKEDVIADLEAENQILRNLLDLPRDQLDQYLKDAAEKAKREKNLASTIGALVDLSKSLNGPY